LETREHGPSRSTGAIVNDVIIMACLHEAIVAAIGRATDRRDDRLV